MSREVIMGDVEVASYKRERYWVDFEVTPELLTDAAPGFTKESLARMQIAKKLPPGTIIGEPQILENDPTGAQTIAVRERGNIRITAVANIFQDVAPEHRQHLAELVDACGSDAVRLVAGLPDGT